MHMHRVQNKDLCVTIIWILLVIMKKSLPDDIITTMIMTKMTLSIMIMIIENKIKGAE